MRTRWPEREFNRSAWPKDEILRRSNARLSAELKGTVFSNKYTSANEYTRPASLPCPVTLFGLLEQNRELWDKSVYWSKAPGGGGSKGRPYVFILVAKGQGVAAGVE